MWLRLRRIDSMFSFCALHNEYHALQPRDSSWISKCIRAVNFAELPLAVSCNTAGLTAF